jgi:hypothetical protein
LALGNICGLQHRRSQTPSLRYAMPLAWGNPWLPSGRAEIAQKEAHSRQPWCGYKSHTTTRLLWTTALGRVKSAVDPEEQLLLPLLLVWQFRSFQRAVVEAFCFALWYCPLAPGTSRRGTLKWRDRMLGKAPPPFYPHPPSSFRKHRKPESSFFPARKGICWMEYPLPMLAVFAIYDFADHAKDFNHA